MCCNAILWKKFIGESLRPTSAQRLIGNGAREYATNVRVKYGDSLTKCEGPNGVRRVVAHARQRQK
jgi:hypothetical protein